MYRLQNEGGDMTGRGARQSSQSSAATRSTTNLSDAGVANEKKLEKIVVFGIHDCRKCVAVVCGVGGWQSERVDDLWCAERPISVARVGILRTVTRATEGVAGYCKLL